MKILFLPSYYKPEKAASDYLSNNRNKTFAESGFYMEAYVPTPCRGVSQEVRNEYKKKTHKVEYEYDNHMTVYRYSLFAEPQNSLFRAFRYGISAIIQIYYGLKVRDVDVMLFSSTPPIKGSIGAFLKTIKKISFVYILQDIFPDSLVGTGLAKKGGLLWKIGRVIENFTYRHADKIIVISEDFKRNIMAKGVPEEKIEVIYNWVDEQAVVNIPREQNKLFDKYNLDRSKFYIEYSGNIGLTQNMDMLLEVMKEMKTSHPEIGLVLVGEGAYKKQVEEIVKRDELTNVTMLPFQPYEDISHVFSLGDVGLVISKPGVGANSVPSKTWSIMSASRPVLANFDENELKDILEGTSHTMKQTSPCGIFTKAGDRETFKAAILKLYEDRELCRKYGETGRQFILDNLTKEVGTSKYVDVIKSVVKE